MPANTFQIIVAVLSIVGAIFAALNLVDRLRGGKAAQAEQRILDAAAREFDGAKPALIHACDVVIDSLPSDIDLSALQAKALISLTALMQRLLGGNVLLTGADLLLMALLPTAFAALPKMVDTAAFKGLLKDEVVKVIRGARL